MPTKLYSGKVRDIYEVDDKHLLMVTSDRISAFDVVMAEPIPDKGRVLTGLTAFWAENLADIAPTHIVSTDTRDFPEFDQDLAGRAMLVRKAEMINVECIVRGYISGSAWNEYSTSGTMHGEAMPEGLRKSEKLPEPVFTPSTKASVGEHDLNISFEQAAEMLGGDLADRARTLSLAAYARGAEKAAERGLIMADTKFELGFIDGELAICDEILTPDSSRLWPADEWSPGSTPPSFDKQPLRDWLEATGWDKTPPPPKLPDDVVSATSSRYREAYKRLTGKDL